MQFKRIGLALVSATLAIAAVVFLTGWASPSGSPAALPPPHGQPAPPVAEPVVASPEASAQQASLCSSRARTLGEMRDILAAGRLANAPMTQPDYYNFSCALEWSKYSCVHQGQVDRARAAAQMRFVHDKCTLLHPSGTDLSAQIGRRFVQFSGHSIARQHFLALACRIISAGASVGHNVTWSDSWPCHGVRNCVISGPHSGFETATVHLRDGGAIAYSDKSSLTRWQRLNPTGRVIRVLSLTAFTAGAAQKEMTGRLKSVLQAVSHGDVVVYRTFSPQHFPAHPDGRYEGTFTNAECLSSVLPSVNNSVYLAEHEALRLMPGDVAVLPVFDLVREFGDLHIGRGQSAGDCTHWCLPGVPDVWVDMMSALLTVSDRLAETGPAAGPTGLAGRRGR